MRNSMVSYDGEELTKGSWTPEVSQLGPGRGLLGLGWPAAGPAADMRYGMPAALLAGG
jgi:hypothetical protein